MPDFDQLIAQAAGFIAARCGSAAARADASPAARGLALIALAVVALWLASGFYRVQPDEQGVVLRFGAYHAPHLPGLN